MTTITYELAPIDQGLTPGVHLGKIINTKIVTLKDSDEQQFVVEWKIGERTLSDKFKLWDETETKRTYAQKKLDDLCKAASIVIPQQKEGETVHFDASVLVGKQVNVLIKGFTSDEGKDYNFIQKYAPPTLNNILSDEVPF